MAGMNARTGRWTRNGAEVVEAFKKAITTPEASRIMRRHLGVPDGTILDAPIEPNMLGRVALNLGKALADEPRLMLRRVGIAAASTDGRVSPVVEVVKADGTLLREPL